GARGIAVSDAVVYASALESDLFTPVFDTLDRVHGDGRLPRMQVTLSQDLFGEEGSFDPAPLPGFPGGRILIATETEFARMTFLHEVGHLIDGYGLGTGRFFGSERMDRFATWREAVDGSSVVRQLRATVVDLATNQRIVDLLRYLL
nr:hypothetical protein [Chloroflexia bacterium]